MSTRHARTADRASNEKYAKVLKTLLQKTPNKYCADCKKKGILVFYMSFHITHPW